MIVSDSAPLIHLSKTGSLELLKQLYGQVFIPRGVFEEVVTQGVGRPGASELQRAVQDGWVKVEEVSVPGSWAAEGMERADAEVIVLASARHMPLLTNDKALATIARIRALPIMWLSRTPLEAVKAGVLSRSQARALLRDLVRSGLRIRSEVFAEIINLIEESGRK